MQVPKTQGLKFKVVKRLNTFKLSVLPSPRNTAFWFSQANLSQPDVTGWDFIRLINPFDLVETLVYILYCVFFQAD